jgi:thiol-disulfide isomerase/thioredoxin
MRTTLFCLSLIAILIATGCQPAAAPVSISNRPLTDNVKVYTDAPLPASKPLGEMSWTDQKDRVQKVSDLKGKAVILDFWATYCEPCRKEIPHLNSLLAKYGKENLEVVGLNVGGEEDLPEIPGFVKKTRLDYPIAFPPIEFTAWVFAEDDAIPQTLVLDRNGVLVDRFVGFGPGIQQNLDEAVAKAVASN